MTKCDYCGKKIEIGLIILNEFSCEYKNISYSSYRKFFCSKECLMSFISNKCREIGIESEEEKLWK